ncbi:MAG: hypothetical protein WBO46_15235 [Caldilineaceae bacterium]
MARAKATRGLCVYCGKEYTRWGMTKHLQSCPQRAEQTGQAADAGKAVPIFHLLVQDAYGGDFWLHLEMPGQTTLQELDGYLRAIWLECCGHLSAFEFDGTRYTQIIEGFDTWGNEASMDVPVAQVFAPGVQGSHEYDFGSTTELALEVVAERTGVWSGKPIALMARNAPPDLKCNVCDKAAEWICIDCMYEADEADGVDDWFFCEEHLLEHEHEDEMALPVVNSPRMGTCGYDGPAEPPY